MTTPQMPHLPGAAVMTDTLDFVKSLWGSMGVPGISIPGIAAPTLSVDELDRKISELKAVESWLNLNATMLRSSIQALEVQRGTIAALKSMGQSLAAAVQQPPQHDPFANVGKPKEAKPAEQPAAPAKPAGDSAGAAAGQMANPAAWWNLLQDQFTQAVNTAMAADPAAKPAADKVGAAHDASKPAAKPAARKPTGKRTTSVKAPSKP
ncbi:PhaM family polyhydroxyalkanoate granule multifunctional regulatory protein [Pseudoduganella violaceinigra]|uniref:PhaM family polyhydroxyalkanoate granule multifunctional regulatory protein n=1 Tax=Pseudoduganella violaceinigra TaxID=246602 RepID=UPI00047FE0A8|nr:PhaM family polyhydroxyalkanoate granule multifunctional regulatory protein [Pseudoduganella violaceinigra]